MTTTRISNVDHDTPTLEWTTDHDSARLHPEPVAEPLVLAAEAALDAQAECEQARLLADVRGVLAEQARREGEELPDAALDRRAEEVCSRDRREGFAAELVARVIPDPETLTLARELDGHALRLWRDVATSLVDQLPPSLVQLRTQVVEDRQAELRTRAGLVHADAEVAARRRVLGRGAWLRRRGLLARVRAEQRTLRDARAACDDRLAHLDATLAAITRREAERAGWLADTGDILARGVAALWVLDDRQQSRGVGGQGGGPAQVGS